MADARALLAEAGVWFDRPTSLLPRAARGVRGFTGGAAWMAAAMAEVRGAPSPRADVRAEALGWTKYGLACAAAACVLALAWTSHAWLLAALAVPAFYAVEAQWVFAFPAALDGAPSPLRASRALTVRAGGTLSVMATVMPIAAFMLFGGLVGRGFLRSWCLGCLAVVLWYERVRRGSR